MKDGTPYGHRDWQHDLHFARGYRNESDACPTTSGQLGRGVLLRQTHGARADIATQQSSLGIRMHGKLQPREGPAPREGN